MSDFMRKVILCHNLFRAQQNSTVTHKSMKRNQLALVSDQKYRHMKLRVCKLHRKKIEPNQNFKNWCSLEARATFFLNSHHVDIMHSITHCNRAPASKEASIKKTQDSKLKTAILAPPFSQR